MFATIEFDKFSSNYQRTRYLQYSRSEDSSGLYRHLSEALYRNVSAFMAKNGSAMGENEQIKKRVKIDSKQKQSNYADLFERHHQKISRECLARNAITRETIENYSTFYKIKHHSCSTQSTHRMYKSQRRTTAQVRTRSESRNMF